MLLPCLNGWRDSSSKVPSPWVALAARPDLNLVRAAIPSQGRYYDTQRTIVIRSGLLIAEERRHLWHELVHADRRDQAGHAGAKTERQVDHHAAQNAMPWDSLLWAWETSTDLAEMADHLKLPEDWVTFRLRNLHPAQKALLTMRVDQFA